MKTKIALLFSFFLLASCSVTGKNHTSYWDVASELRQGKWVDLTHSFDNTIPHWKGFEPMKIKTLFDHDKDGFRVDETCHVGQWGTHIDPPSHFHKGKRTIEDITVQEMLLPLVVIDVHEKVKTNPDYQLTLDDIKDWEKRNGKIPANSFVAMRTDWAKRWPNQEKMQNVDSKGVSHYPGWSLETLKFLYEERSITASGHETTDTDPGIATTKDDYSLESYILSRDHYQIELLADLDQIPEAGAIAVVSWPKLAKGSGFPARVFAVVPKN